MLKELSRIPANYLSRKFNLVPSLPFSLVFSVTYKCNFQCKTCNIWKNQDCLNEMTLPQIEAAFRSLGRSLFWITLDGGEPFLRRDLPDICEILYRNCRTKIINIPSNGSQPAEILEAVKKILRLCPVSYVLVNLSLDHIGERHDEIRGHKGAFRLLCETYQGLRQIGNRRLRIGINTVISSYNIEDWQEIHSFVKKINPDSHLFEIAQWRDEFMNHDLKEIVPSKEQCSRFLTEMRACPSIRKTNVLNAALHSIRKNYYSLISRNMESPSQALPCFAGISSSYILPDGRIWACCNSAKLMGDLKEHGYNFKKIWLLQTAKDIRRAIKDNKCSCTQVNLNYLNLLHSPRFLIKFISQALF